MPLKCPPGFYKVSNALTGEEECRPDPSYVPPPPEIEIIEGATTSASPEAFQQTSTSDQVVATVDATPEEAEAATSTAPSIDAEAASSPAKAWAALVAAAPLPADATPAAKATAAAAKATVRAAGKATTTGGKDTTTGGKDTTTGGKDTGGDFVNILGDDDSVDEEDTQTPILLTMESAVEPGRTFRGPAPPPCDDPPYEYAEEAICISNSTAFVPDWTGLSLPFLNERTCQYSVPIQTEECPQGLDLHPQVVGFAPEGITSLMEFLKKQSTPLAETVLTSYIEESAQEPYDPAMIATRAYETNLAPRESLKILFKWPFGLVRALRLEDVLTAPVTDAPAGAENVELFTDGLLDKLDRLAQQLEIYAREQAVMWKRQEIKFCIAGTTQEINILEEKSKIDSLKSSITNLLSSNDYEFSTGQNRTRGTAFEIPTTVSVAEQLAMFYEPGYNLVSAYARQRGSDYAELGLAILQTEGGLKDPTLFSYLTRIEDILFDLDRSSPMGILEFVTKYHYPAVTVTDGLQANPPLGFAEGCVGSELSNIVMDAGRSIIDQLPGLDDLFADKFAEYVCMTPRQFAERNRQIRASREEFEALIQKEASAVLPVSDPLVRAVVQGIENIAENGPTIATAWEKLFNKMSMCGLLSLLGRTVEFLGNNSFCGISAQDAMMMAIQSALKGLKPMDLKRVFDGIEPPALRGLIQDRYFETVSEFMREVGSTTGLIFPWDYEERVRTQSEREEQGLLLYSADLFSTPAEALPTEYEGSLATAFLQGYQHNMYTPPSGSMREELLAAYWDGYVQHDRDFETDPTGINPSYNIETGELEINETQARELANNVRITLNRQHGADVGRLVRGLANDTMGFLIETLASSVIGVVIENLTFDQIIEMFEDIPVLGAILRVLPQASKCVINANVTRDGEAITLSQLQDNLFGGGRIDICNLPAAKKPIVLPDIELLLSQLRIDTLWSSFQNALLEVLKKVLISILLRTLIGILREAIEVILGFACAATQGDAENFLQGQLPPGLVPRGNMKDFLLGSLCPDDRETLNPDEALANLISSLLPGVTQGDAENLLGPQSECNFIDRVEEVLTASQLLDLFVGDADPNTLTAVLAVINRHCADLQVVLPSTSSVATFFRNLGSSFPQEYLNQLRDLLQNTPSIIDIPPDLCPEDEVVDNLREALNCEGEATPEQIDAYIEAFQARLGQTIDDMVGALSNGLDDTLTSQIQSALQELMPKDEPGNLLIAEQIVEALFSPLYGFYARDLMHIMGASGRPFNAGLINMILANRNAVGQVGQIRNYGAHAAFVTGPGLDFMAQLPPPFNLIATAGQLGGVGDNLRKTYFGEEPEEGDLETERCNDAIPTTLAAYNEIYGDDSVEEEDVPGYEEWRAGQRRARAECRARNRAAIAAGLGPGPYGYGKLRKPTTVAKSLQTIFLDLSSVYTETAASEVTISFPVNASMEANINAPTIEYTEDSKLFDIVYNFRTGLLQYIPYVAIAGSATTRSSVNYIERAPREQWIEVDSTNNLRLEADLAEYFSELPLPIGDLNINPVNVGAGVLLNEIRRFSNPGVDWDEETAQWLADCRRISTSMGQGLAVSFGRAISNNESAFTYGEYNLDRFTDDNVLNPSAEILAKGYNFIYLDDGRIFIEPPLKGGWLEIKDNLLPSTSETFCCPDRKELFNVQSIVDRTLEGFKVADEDPRLSLNPRSVKEPPFARALSRMNLASCEGNIIATIRAYCIEYFLQGFATFNKYPPRSPQVHSDIFAEYIAAHMKLGMLDQANQPGAPVWPPGLIPGTPYGDGLVAERLHAYWYEFLEQCVQTYSRRIKSGQVGITGEVNVAMTNCQNALDNFIEPSRFDVVPARNTVAALFLAIPILTPFIPIVLPQVNLKSLRRKVKIDVIRENEANAMIILKQLIKEELNRIADDVEDIFTEPPGGRADNIYIDFLRNCLTSDGKNIFDIPLDPTDSSAPARAISTTMTGGDDLRWTIDLQKDQYILQSYVVATQADPGLNMLRSPSDITIPLFPNGWIDGQPYPISIVEEMLEYAISQDMDPTTPLSELFEEGTFKYGLRLVFCPSPRSVESSVELFDNMRTSGASNNMHGLFRHPPSSESEEGSLGEFTLPIVYTETLEAPFEGSIQQFVDAVNAEGSSFNVDTNGSFLWADLAALLIETDQFRAMFEYAIPMNSVLSLLGIYNAEAFLDSIGGDDGWYFEAAVPRPYRRWNRRVFPILKRRLKKQFKAIYNSNDFTYIDDEERPGRNSRRLGERFRLGLDFNIDTLFDDLTWPVKSRITYTDPTCYSDATGTPDFTEEALPPGYAPGEDVYTGPPPDTTWEPGEGEDELVCCRLVGTFEEEVVVTTRRECREFGGEEIDPTSVGGCEELIMSHGGPDDTGGPGGGPPKPPGAPPGDDDDPEGPGLDLPEDPEFEDPLADDDGGGSGTGTGGRSGGGPEL